MAVGPLHVEANPGSLAVVDRVFMVHVLHEIPPPFPLSVVVATVHLQRSSEVVGGLQRAARTGEGGASGDGWAQILKK